MNLARADARCMPVRSGVVQLLLTDPPYNIGIPYPGYFDRQPWEAYWAMAEEFLREGYRVLRSGGVLALVLPFTAFETVDTRIPHTRRGRRASVAYRVERRRVGDVIPMLAEWTQRAISAGFLYEDTLSIVTSWSGEGEGYAVGTGIGGWSRPKMRTVARVLVLLHKDKRAVPNRDGRWGWGSLDDCKNHWYCPPAWHQGLGHPTPLPPLIPLRVVNLWSNPGDVVLDAFCGSGTVVDVARQEGRIALGMDISPESVEIAAKRMAQTVLALGDA